jgi:hypothetical protein
VREERGSLSPRPPPKGGSLQTSLVFMIVWSLVFRVSEVMVIVFVIVFVGIGNAFFTL